MTVFAGPRPDAVIEIAPLFSTMPDACMGKPGASRTLMSETAASREQRGTRLTALTRGRDAPRYRAQVSPPRGEKAQQVT